ncbi:ATP synthase F1 subunit delta [Ghiorsea bivora]|uniref:ATP synthase F1 subunit delta n=1 Tax=Ghiorsea bivora TaxID=1485545 RepID=UPI0005708534|nr:ATP synthase F1 subunit delta [Ghiorsea bivora]
MSTERSIASRYATALFELHQEGIDVAEDLSKVAQVTENEDAQALLINSQIPAEDRAKAVLKAASVKDEYVLRLLVMLCSRNKATLLVLINEMLDKLIREEKSEVMVDVTVAKDLKADLANKLKESISAGLGKAVELNVKTDASILGGLILNIGDRQIDHSVRGRINGLKRALSV